VRLFVAVNLPDALRRTIHEALAGLRSAQLPIRWVDLTGMHVTLKFLGEVPPERVADAEDALGRAAAGMRAFSLAVEGAGAFPSADRARVVWVGCEAAPPLELLQHAVEREYAALGYPVEGRPFRPHITMGRAQARARGGVRGLGERLGTVSIGGEFVARSVDLMESTLGRAGATYAVRRAVPLA
jgi:RNA 2',3'-cyclic 3'-phosphodiesterase